MFVVTLLFVALFSQAFADINSSEEFDESAVMNDPMMMEMEKSFKESHPLPYKIIELIRMMFGISKSEMTNISLRGLEVAGALKDLWDTMKKVLRRKTPKRYNNNQSNRIRRA